MNTALQEHTIPLCRLRSGIKQYVRIHGYMKNMRQVAQKADIAESSVKNAEQCFQKYRPTLQDIIFRTEAARYAELPVRIQIYRAEIICLLPVI